jgi:hypothetical protein
MIKIGVDLDNVLCNFNDAINDFYNKRTGRSFRSKDYVHETYDKVWGVTMDVSTKVVRDFSRTRGLDDLMPIKGARECLESLLKTRKFQFYIITSRNKSLEKRTKSWLERNYGSIFSGVEFLSYYASRGKSSLEKYHVCKRLGCKAMIEDSPHHLLKCVLEHAVEFGILFNDDGRYMWLDHIEERI